MRSAIGQMDATAPAKPWRRTAFWVGQLTLWLAVIYLLARQIVDHWNELSAFSITIQPVFLLVAFFGILFHKGLYGYAWYLWIRPFQQGARPIPTMAGFFVSALLNYLPGAVWPALWLARINRSAQGATDPRGERVGTVMSWLQLQVIGIIAAAITLGIGAAFMSLRLAPWIRAASLAVAAGASLFLLPAVRGGALALLAAIVRRPDAAATRPGRLWPVVLLMVIANLIAGAWFWVFIAAFFPAFHTSYANVLFIGFASQFAAQLAVGIPSGIGVRELALTLLLQQDGLMTAPEALATSILLRLFYVVADLALPALFVYPWMRLRKS